MKQNECRGMNRRGFLARASLGTAAVAGVSTSAAVIGKGLPTVQLGDHAVTRLIAGYNPVGGHSHLNANISNMMRSFFTVERTVEFLNHCAELGINTFQFDLTDKVKQALDIVWDQGSQLQFLCLHAERAHDDPIKEVIKYRAFAIAHHGGVTDAKFRDGKADQVHDFVKKVHDAGALAGVSTHCPANLARMQDEGWENDFFMGCFHYVSRTREEMEKDLGLVTVGEPYIESDRDTMAATICQIDKPCLAFKILAAGRRCNSQGHVAKAFQFAFDNIKKTDAVIVGMFPRDQDEVKFNLDHAKKYGRV